jgi:hypothetical protein
MIPPNQSVDAVAAGVVELAVDAWLFGVGAGEGPLSSAARLGGLASLPFALAGWAGTFVVLDERARFGRDARRFGSALGQGFRFFGSYFGLGFMMGIAMIPALIPGGVFLGLEIHLVGIPLIAAGAIFDLYLLLKWSVANVVVVIEGMGASGAMSRSSALLKGRMQVALGFLFVCSLVMVGALALFGGIAYLLVMALGLPELVWDLGLNFFNTVFAGPFIYVAAFVLFAALRSRA